MSETKNPKPNRAPDFEDHGFGKAPENIQERADNAYYAELYVDAMGEPAVRSWWKFWERRRLPRAWWHLKLWEHP